MRVGEGLGEVGVSLRLVRGHCLDHSLGIILSLGLQLNLLGI